jgi:hypothetical protein
VIIVGWGHQKREVVGPLDKRSCPNCHNVDYWELHRIRNFGTLFFIPVLPYATEYLEVCPICKASRKVASEDVAALKKFAEMNMEQIRAGGPR